MDQTRPHHPGALSSLQQPTADASGARYCTEKPFRYHLALSGLGKTFANLQFFSTDRKSRNKKEKVTTPMRRHPPLFSADTPAFFFAVPMFRDTQKRIKT